LVVELGLEDRVIFFGRIRLDDLWKYTQKAHIGISLEEDLGLNYRYSLPNKLFDYIQSRIPVIVSDLPEMRKLVEKFQIGEILRNRTPESLASLVEKIKGDKSAQTVYQQKLELAARELCWQREEEKLIKLYRQASEEVSKNNA
jgi:glycosyltransferase involved in cell wall biosynthesis